MIVSDKRSILALVALTMGIHSSLIYAATPLSLIPQPQHIEQTGGHYEITAATCLIASETFSNSAAYFRESVGTATDFTFSDTQTDAGCVVIETDSNLPHEAYSLQVGSNGVRIQAADDAGAFYAVQTLRQLMPTQVYALTAQQGVRWVLPTVNISDAPEFVWRGMMLDVGRHFMPKAFVKKFLDLMAIHKMNKFHWHLTEDQGWRIEIKQYPKLTEIGAHRDETLVGHFRDGMTLLNLLPWYKYDAKYYHHQYDGMPHDGFYTQEDIKEIVAYAKTLHIEVIPEIEMPGHAQAAIAAYPELGNTGKTVKVKQEWGVSHQIFNPEETTITFLKNVLTEVMALFPSEYVHIGGDEADKKLWEDSPRVQALIEERGLAGEAEMQSWFVGQMNTFLMAHGRKLIGWDEILEGGLSKGATVMSWRGAEGGIKAAQAGHDVIMAENTATYFDFYQSENTDEEPLAIHGHTPLQQVYEYNPVPDELSKTEQARILGTQGQMWTEYMKTPAHVEYMAFPRATALSEVMWLNQPAQQRSFTNFSTRLRTHLRRLDRLDVQYRPLD